MKSTLSDINEMFSENTHGETKWTAHFQNWLRFETVRHLIVIVCTFEKSDYTNLSVEVLIPLIIRVTSTQI